MLSLNKTKSREELVSWLGSHTGLLSWKMDGLTVVLSYSNGELIKAVTRGNGEIGEVITPNAKAFKNVPLKISYKGELTLRGEAIIRYSDFEKINAQIPDADAKYKNPRNLCSGSVRQLDSSITAQRSVCFYAFALISMDGEDGFATRGEQLDYLDSLGFLTVERTLVSAENVVTAVEDFSNKITGNDFPSDGLVLLYDDIAYGRSLGRTAKFPRDGIAFKWADEEASTILREIEWSASRTGLINPVAIFDPVELEGTTVSRASIHNVSIVDELHLAIGDTIKVYKANMIIPQISENLTKGGGYTITDAADTSGNILPSDSSSIQISGKQVRYINSVVASCCPVCGQPTVIHDEDGIRTLFCENPDCSAKKIGLFSHMADRNALNIEGLSEATIEKFVDAGIIGGIVDFFRLSVHKDTICNMEGFGEKSASKLLDAIEAARHTTLSRLVYALGIPNIGLANAKVICKYVSNEPSRIPALSADELVSIEGIGDVLAASFTDYIANESNLCAYNELAGELIFEEEANTGSELEGKVFVITGSVEHFANRNELKAFIESKGGKVTGSVTGNTDYLINNDINSGSSKNKTAKSLGVAIITEEDFLNLVNQ